MRELTVFSRNGCHLCDYLIEQLVPWCDAAGVRLRVLDVDSRDDWREQYGLRVPVVCAEGEELCAWPPDEGRIRAWLEAARSGA
ncbi:MAG: glutaredoxin family protein [Gammaproteobacteria bacterium]|nr:glutaredoxin family protein [Gammaproteobacteria bacterium]